MSDSNSPTFRRAERRDVPAIVALLEDDPISASRGGPDVGADFYGQAFDAIDADPRNLLVVAEDDGEIVGTLQLTFIPSLSRRGSERALVEAVRVRRDRRGSGLGRRFMMWAMDRARERGCRLMQLTTDKRRADAQRFYASLGFAATHEGMKMSL